MTKHTKKVGIVGKYGTRYGASLRKQVKKVEEKQRKTYKSPFCGKTCLKRKATGIWICRATGKTLAGGAYEPQTPASIALKAIVRRLRESEEL